MVIQECCAGCYPTVRYLPPPGKERTIPHVTRPAFARDLSAGVTTLSLTAKQLHRVTDALITERRKILELRDAPCMADLPGHHAAYDKWIAQLDSIAPLLPESEQWFVRRALAREAQA